ncbi:MAG: hypothetical protein R3F62_01380 [Planctomycetota bacterium]
MAEGAPPPPKVPLGAELPDACPECAQALEAPDGKEEPDGFCYHCGASLFPEA